jgi:hypothetical protein
VGRFPPDAGFGPQYLSKHLLPNEAKGCARYPRGPITWQERQKGGGRGEGGGEIVSRAHASGGGAIARVGEGGRGKVDC